MPKVITLRATENDHSYIAQIKAYMVEMGIDNPKNSDAIRFALKIAEKALNEDRL